MHHFKNLSSLPHFPTRKTKGTKLLVHYNRSHFVTSMEYFEIFSPPLKINPIFRKKKKVLILIMKLLLELKTFFMLILNDPTMNILKHLYER
jgi:hypothetical protein